MSWANQYSDYDLNQSKLPREVKKDIRQGQPVSSDSTITETVNRKKELLLKEYDSLFTVYGRETSIVYNFRGWTILLLSAYFTYVFTVKHYALPFLYLPGVFIIITFYFLEVSERSVMRYLRQEIRNLERVFMLETTLDFNMAVLKFEFRDLKDEKKPFRGKVANFIKAMFSLKILAWNLFLFLIYFTLVFYYENDIADKNPKSPAHAVRITRKPGSNIHKQDTVKHVKKQM